MRSMFEWDALWSSTSKRSGFISCLYGCFRVVKGRGRKEVSMKYARVTSIGG